MVHIRYNNVVLFFIWQKREMEGCIIAINGLWLCCFLFVSCIFREATRFDFPYASITDDIRKYALQDDLPSVEEITGNLGSPVFLVKIFIILIFKFIYGNLHSHRHNEKFIFFLKLLRVEILCQCTYMYIVHVITLSVDSPWAWSDQCKFQ